MENEINFESLNDVSYDISSLDMDASKIDMLAKLGVNTSEDFNTVSDDILNEVETQEVQATIDINVNEPNIILSRAELIRALRYAGVMIKKVTNDIEASSLNITYKDEGKVEYKLKDNMTWVTIQGTCKVSNNNPLLKTLSFNTTYLTKLLSAAAGDFLIYEENSIDAKGEEKKVLFARLINGDYILDVFEGNEEKLIPKGNVQDLLKEVEGNKINTLCDVMSPLIADTQEVQSKRTIIYGDRAIFRSVTYLLQYKGDFTPMCLSKKELDLLKIASNGSNVEIFSTDSNGENRILLNTPNVSISTSVSIPNRDEVLITRLNELENAQYMRINKNDFKRVLFLSGLGTANVAKVTMNYNVEGLGIDAKIIGKNGNSSFLISGENYNNLPPRNEDVTIYAPQLSTLLKSFESGKDLEIAFLQSGVAFRDNTLGIEAIMNYVR